MLQSALASNSLISSPNLVPKLHGGEMRWRQLLHQLASGARRREPVTRSDCGTSAVPLLLPSSVLGSHVALQLRQDSQNE